MIFFNPEIMVKNQNGIFDFTYDIPAYNQVTVPILYCKEKCQKVYVGMENVNKYFDTPYFPVKLQCYYDEGRRYFYVTGFISQNKILLSNDTLEMVVKHLLPLIDIEPLDKNEYGNNLKSKLAMYGYNVRKDELTEEQRHNIIDFVIEHQFMTPIDVINLLERNITFVHNRYAQKKWKVDVDYIRNRYF